MSKFDRNVPAIGLPAVAGVVTVPSAFVMPLCDAIVDVIEWVVARVDALIRR